LKKQPSPFSIIFESIPTTHLLLIAILFHQIALTSKSLRDASCLPNVIFIKETTFFHATPFFYTKSPKIRNPPIFLPAAIFIYAPPILLTMHILLTTTLFSVSIQFRTSPRMFTKVVARRRSS
jgi:hypothetical protein